MYFSLCFVPHCTFVLLFEIECQLSCTCIVCSNICPNFNLAFNSNTAVQFVRLLPIQCHLYSNTILRLVMTWCIYDQSHANLQLSV